eukprot:18828_6
MRQDIQVNVQSYWQTNCIRIWTVCAEILRLPRRRRVRYLFVVLWQIPASPYNDGTSRVAKSRIIWRVGSRRMQHRIQLS